MIGCSCGAPMMFVSDITLFVNVKLDDVYVEVEKQFTNKQKFEIRAHMLQYIYTKASNLEFNIVKGGHILVFV